MKVYLYNYQSKRLVSKRTRKPFSQIIKERSDSEVVFLNHPSLNKIDEVGRRLAI